MDNCIQLLSHNKFQHYKIIVESLQTCLGISSTDVINLKYTKWWNICKYNWKQLKKLKKHNCSNYHVGERAKYVLGFFGPSCPGSAGRQEWVTLPEKARIQITYRMPWQICTSHQKVRWYISFSGFELHVVSKLSSFCFHIFSVFCLHEYSARVFCVKLQKRLCAQLWRDDIYAFFIRSHPSTKNLTKQKLK